MTLRGFLFASSKKPLRYAKARSSGGELRIGVPIVSVYFCRGTLPLKLAKVGTTGEVRIRVPFFSEEWPGEHKVH